MLEQVFTFLWGGFLTQSKNQILCGAVVSTISYFVKKSKTFINSLEDIQTSILKMGYIPESQNYDSVRPIQLSIGFGLIPFGYGMIEKCFNIESLDNLKIINNKTVGMAALFAGLGIISYTSQSYFIDQQTMPPSIKKSFLKTLYNSIMNNSNEINAPVEKILK